MTKVNSDNALLSEAICHSDAAKIKKLLSNESQVNFSDISILQEAIIPYEAFY